MNQVTELFNDVCTTSASGIYASKFLTTSGTVVQLGVRRIYVATNTFLPQWRANVNNAKFWFIYGFNRSSNKVWSWLPVSGYIPLRNFPSWRLTIKLVIKEPSIRCWDAALTMTRLVYVKIFRNICSWAPNRNISSQAFPQDTQI